MNLLGLNINVAKVRYETSEEFRRHWGFSIMAALDDPRHLADGIELLQAAWRDQKFGRKTTTARRAVNLLSQRPQLRAERSWISNELLSDDELLIDMTDRQMVKLVDISDHPRRALETVANVILEAPFSGPKVRLLRAAETLKDVRGLGALSNRIYKRIASDPDRTVRRAILGSRQWSDRPPAR